MFVTRGTEHQHVMGPSLQNSGRNSRLRWILEQINLALERFNSDMCSVELEVIRRNRRILKNEASHDPKKNRMHNLDGGEVYWYSHP